MQEYEEIWNLALGELGKINSKTVMSLWFKDIKLINLTDSHAVFYVPSEWKRGMIEKNFSTSISKTLESVLGYRVDIVFSGNETVSDAEETHRDFTAEESFSSIEEQKKADEPALTEPSDSLDEDQGDNAEPSFFSTSETVTKKQSISPSTDHTFENFIVGESNKFAHAACISVSRDPAHSYNPLFIYGPSGLGKTHLLYAIINEIHRTRPEFNIIYVKGDEFTNQMIESISKGKTAEFREKFRKADVLLIDDIHFIAGRESTQEEFFHTFNDLHEHKKQIILTSDRPARDIQKLEERLRTRFEWGLSADIQPPNFELRVAIMRKKAETLGVPFSLDVLNFLAEKLTNNVRQMEGAIKKIIAYSQLTNEEIDIQLVTNCISDLLTNNGEIKITPEKIISKVAEKYSIHENDIYSQKRTSNIAQARHICIYLMKKLLDASYPSMGRLLKRDHTTIMHSYDRIEKEIKNNSTFEIEINELIKEFHS